MGEKKEGREQNGRFRTIRSRRRVPPDRPFNLVFRDNGVDMINTKDRFFFFMRVLPFGVRPGPFRIRWIRVLPTGIDRWACDVCPGADRRACPLPRLL